MASPLTFEQKGELFVELASVSFNPKELTVTKSNAWESKHGAGAGVNGSAPTIEFSRSAGFVVECSPSGCTPRFALDDIDVDGVPDSRDNCPDEANADQSDRDGDDLGDACDPTRG